MKATEQYFPVVLFIALFAMILTLKSVDKALKCALNQGLSSLKFWYSGLEIMVYDPHVTLK